MKFGPVAVADAEDTILAHAVQAGGKRLKKGSRLDRAALDALEAAGIAEVIVARLDPGDVDENAAAAALAAAFSGEGVVAAPPGTGRANLHAARRGLFRADRDLVDALNLIDPAITFASLDDRTVVEAGDMVATIKIIPLAVPSKSLERAKAAIAAPGLAEVKPLRAARVGMVATKLPTVKASVMEKTRATTAERLRALGSELVFCIDVAHETQATADGIREALRHSDLVLVFGASAVTDADDVIPAAIRAAGGRVERVGMPVDPGNLLVMGSVDAVPVIGAPGCARSPKENGFDWVLARILSGEDVRSDDIARLGVGGLLMEIPTRPQPRESMERAREEGISIVLLAAGSASRMGTSAGHKLLAEFDGEPLIRRLAARAKASAARDVIVVLGHRAADIRAALAGIDVRTIDNSDHATGMASSLKVGISALSPGCAGAMILLGDMPGVTTADLDRLISTFSSAGGTSIVRACDGEMRGNPVILPHGLVPDLMKLEGDAGARGLIETSGYPIIDVDIGAAARLDVDTPDAVRAAGGVTELQG